MFVHIVIALTFISLSKSQQYRSDYEYNKKTNAFYKLHIDSDTRYLAGEMCEAEGANLILPASDFDISQVHGMLKRYPDIGQYAWVSEDDMQHESAEEQPVIDLDTRDDDRINTSPWRTICQVIDRKGEVKTDLCRNKLPFVCKVDAKAAYFDKTCEVYGKNYQYISSIGSCYRISDIVYSWNEAYAECNAEGAHLVVLNSVAEHEAVYNIIRNHKRNVKEHWFFFAGFRANKPTTGEPRTFKTIFNETLIEAGYGEWADSEPNNANNKENCGSIFKNDGKLNDLECTVPHLFICEKEIRLKLKQ